MNEVLRDAIGVLVVGRELTDAEPKASWVVDVRALRRRLAGVVHRDEGRRALMRLVTDALGVLDAHRLDDASLVARVADAIEDGRLAWSAHAAHDALQTAPKPRLLRESGRTPSAPKPAAPAATAAVAAAVAAPALGKKWPPDPTIPPEYPHMARVQSAAVLAARRTIDVTLDGFVFRDLDPIPEAVVPEEFVAMAKLEAEALRDLAAELRASLNDLMFRRVAADAALPKPE
jgi:hypothetical protein